MSSKANVRGNRIEMFIDGVRSPISVTVNPSDFNQLFPITDARVGATPIGYLIEGHPLAIACEFREEHKDQFIRATGTASDGRALMAGELMPTHAIRLHNPARASNTTADIVIPAAVFTDFALVAKTGTGSGGYTCTIRAVKPDDEDLPDWWIGYIAPDDPDDDDDDDGIGVAPDPVPLPDPDEPDEPDGPDSPDEPPEPLD